jgi:hypothetical protein
VNNLQNALSAENYAAHQIALRATQGAMPEDEARLAIAGLIERAGVARDVANEVPGLTSRHRTELTSLLSDMVLGRATGTGGFKKDLDLKRLADGGEATAWGRQLARTGVQSKLRDIRLVDSKHVLVSPLEPNANDTLTGVESAFLNAPTLSVEETVEETRFNDSLNSLQDLKGLRHTGQVKQNAHHLRTAWEITAPIVVPEAAADRAWVVEQLETNPMLAYASLLAWLDIAAPTTISDLIVGLWDDFTYEQGEQLSEYRPGFAHTLALAAVMLMPKPSRDVMKQAVTLVTMAAPGHEWDVHAAALVESWVATQCAPFSEFKAKSRGDEGAVLMAHELAAAAWPSMVKQTTKWHRAPLGATEEAVEKFIGRVFTGIDSANFPGLG